MERLDGKIALVTGAARGLGLAIARRFRDEGADVIINDLDQAAADKAAAEIGGTAIAADVADSAAVAAMFERVAADYGRLDVLVNNAGIGVETEARAEEMRSKLGAQSAEIGAGGAVDTHMDITVSMSDEEWRRMLSIHLDGTFFCTREALKIMNPQLSGAIVNIASIMGTAGGAGIASYCAAKAGILGFTRSVAREVVTRGIRVNAVAPGWIDTEMTSFLGDARAIIAAQTPMGRFGEPDDIAWAVVYLASEEAKFVTGQVLSPNGGIYMSQ